MYLANYLALYTPVVNTTLQGSTHVINVLLQDSIHTCRKHKTTRLCRSLSQTLHYGAHTRLSSRVHAGLKMSVVNTKL